MIGLACLLATLCNPYGWHLYELAGNVTRDAYLLRSIGELKPPDPRFVVVLRGIFATVAVCAGILWSVPPDASGRWRGPAGVRFLGGVAMATIIVFTFVRTHLVLVQTMEAWMVIAFVLWRLRPPGALAHALMVCFFAYQGIYHVRHLPLLAIVLLPTLAWSLEAAARTMGTRIPGRALAVAGWSVLIVAAWWWTFAKATWWPPVAISLGLTEPGTIGPPPRWFFSGLEANSYWERNAMLAGGQAMQPMPINNHATAWVLQMFDDPRPQSTLPAGNYLIEPYPVAAMDWLIAAELPRRLWTYGNMSGYFIWRLAPEHYLLFTDNRYDIYGGDFIRQEHAVLNGWTQEQLRQGGATREDGFYPWNEVLDRWDVQTVVIPFDAKGNGALSFRLAWEQVYGDFHVNIWVRKTPENEAAIARANALPRPQAWIRQIH
jgi:hypothetical protein